MFVVAAILFFILAAIGVGGAYNLVAIGLACVAAHLLFGPWPIGAPPWRA